MLLADAWERWARRCAELTPEQWSAQTRCHPWDVNALVAHLCPDPAMFDMLDGARIDGPALSPDVAVDHFIECARILRATSIPTDDAIAYPDVGSTTLAVVTEVALMEATVHLLDLADAVGGVEPSPDALAATRDLLIAVPDPTAAVEVLAGRVAPAAVLPAIR